MQSQRTVNAASLKLMQKKDMTKKEIEELDKQLKGAERLKKLKIENK